MELICINCPRGCHLTVDKVNDEIVVSGNFCPRGKTYAINELTNPLRVVTTTIPINSIDHKRLAVITSKAVKKELIFDIMKQLKDLKVSAPIKMNDVIVKNICDSGADIIASRSILK